MIIKLSGLLFVAINILFLYLSFCPLWAKLNLVAYTISLIFGFIAVALMDNTDKIYYSMDLGDSLYKLNFKTFRAIAICGLFSVLEMVSSIVLIIYFFISL